MDNSEHSRGTLDYVADPTAADFIYFDEHEDEKNIDELIQDKANDYVHKALVKLMYDCECKPNLLFIIMAKFAGVSYAEIGHALGISRQAAHKMARNCAPSGFAAWLHGGRKQGLRVATAAEDIAPPLFLRDFRAGVRGIK